MFTINDPIYKEIFVDEDVKNIINCHAFQRLHDLKQTGFAYKLFPSATHSRYSHSLGVYYLVTYLLQNNKNVSQQLSNYDKRLLIYSCLLHDVGHGPYSHFFENITNISHEFFSTQIILRDKELNKILSNIHPNLPEDICKVLNKKYKNKIINKIVSSNVDIDRMDYLLRDSYFCGINFGNIDYNWILRNMLIQKNKIVFKSGSLNSLENFLIARYHMYSRIYLNIKMIKNDLLILKIIERIKCLLQQNFNFRKAIIHKEFIDIILWESKFKNYNIEDYLKMTDNSFLSFIMQFYHVGDEVLHKLIWTLLHHDNFSLILSSSSEVKKIQNKIKRIKEKHKNNAKYYYGTYCLKNITSGNSFFKYSTFNVEPVYMLKENDSRIVKIQTLSPIIRGLLKEFTGKFIKLEYFYYLKIYE